MAYIQKKTEHLQISPELLLYSKSVLSKKQMQQADLLAEEITGKYTRPRAIYALREIIGEVPKRPMYYAHYELEHLPTWTRNIIRYLGDYIDQLVKFLTAEKLAQRIYLSRSLGSNLKSLSKKDILSSNLITQLTKYNDLLYVPAKHDFNVGHRNHRFTSKEVIYTCFITMYHAKKIEKTV